MVKRTTKAQRAHLADLRDGIDFMEERDGWNWVVDSEGLYAAVKTAHYEPEKIEEFYSNSKKLPVDKFGFAAQVIAKTGYLTLEQKKKRLAILSAEWAGMAMMIQERILRIRRDAFGGIVPIRLGTGVDHAKNLIEMKKLARAQGYDTLELFEGIQRPKLRRIPTGLKKTVPIDKGVRIKENLEVL